MIKKVENSHFFIAPGHDPSNFYKLAKVLLQHRPVVEVIRNVLALDGRHLAGRQAPHPLRALAALRPAGGGRGDGICKDREVATSESKVTPGRQDVARLPLPTPPQPCLTFPGGLPSLGRRRLLGRSPLGLRGISAVAVPAALATQHLLQRAAEERAAAGAAQQHRPFFRRGHCRPPARRRPPRRALPLFLPLQAFGHRLPRLLEERPRALLLRPAQGGGGTREREGPHRLRARLGREAEGRREGEGGGGGRALLRLAARQRLEGGAALGRLEAELRRCKGPTAAQRLARPREAAQVSGRLEAEPRVARRGPAADRRREGRCLA